MLHPSSASSCCRRLLRRRQRQRTLMMIPAAAASTAAASQQQQQQLAAQEAREDALWLAKPTHARLLQPPPHARLAGDTRHQPVLSLENWLHRRGWSAALDDGATPSSTTTAGKGGGAAGAIAAPGLRVLSHLLSYPLTLAHYLSHIAPAPPSPSSAAAAALVVLGARAEATLPSLWWRELLCYHGASHLNLHLHMVGPELPPGRAAGPGGEGGERVPLALEQGQQEQQRAKGAGELMLYRHRGLYHELMLADGGSFLPSKPLAYVAFNPGFGHPHLSEAWKPTLDAALLQHQQQQGPLSSPMVLWTAHSAADRDRDVAFLDRHFSRQAGAGQSGVVDWLLAPMANPFASRKRVAGGVGEDKEAIVQANMYVGVFRVRRM